MDFVISTVTTGSNRNGPDSENASVFVLFVLSGIFFLSHLPAPKQIRCLQITASLYEIKPLFEKVTGGK